MKYRPQYINITLAYVLPYCLLAVMLSLLPMLADTPTGGNAEIVSSSLSRSPEGPWQAVQLRQLKLPENHAWLKVVFRVPSAEVSVSSPPKGLFLSGGFSARVNWNGIDLETAGGTRQPVELKGLPSKSLEGERAGPIDAVIYLPKEITRPGNNTLMLELSSHYRPEVASSVITGKGAVFGLRVADFRPDERRPISYYIIPLLMIAIYLIALLMIASQGDGDRRAKRLAMLIVASLAVAGLAEISRAFFAYPYSYHSLRLAAIDFSLAVLAAALVLYCLHRSGLVAEHESRWLPAILLFALVVTFFSDDESLLLTMAIVVSLLLVLKTSVQAQSWSELPWLAAFTCLGLFALWDSYLFIDQNLYAASVPLLALLAWPSMGAVVSGSNEPGDTATVVNKQIVDTRLRVKQGRSESIVPFEDILLISGAGNYAEILTLDKRQLLDDRSLKQLQEALSENFFRIHRSRIANLNHAKALNSLGGGKYTLSMTNDESYSVSRGMVAELRQRLGR